jgi:hypothetical protein
MRPIGFSTGALALGNFQQALDILRGSETRAVELSALREHEVAPLMEALPTLDLKKYSYVSIHAPSAFRTNSEQELADLLSPCIAREVPVVIHPDAIQNPDCWRKFGSLMCIENMDKRKQTGRTTSELEEFFVTFPDATFCFDVGHCRQIDSTMGEARRMLQRFRDRLRQVHFSEIDAQGRHHGTTIATILASRSIVDMTDSEVPVIIESQIPASDISKEIEAVRQALDPSHGSTAEQMPVDWGALA